jgi:hypothetical protein
MTNLHTKKTAESVLNLFSERKAARPLVIWGDATIIELFGDFIDLSLGS